MASGVQKLDSNDLYTLLVRVEEFLNYVDNHCEDSVMANRANDLFWQVRDAFTQINKKDNGEWT